MDSVAEAVVVFDTAGRVVFVNEPARRVLRGDEEDLAGTEVLLPRLGRLGARVVPLWVEGEKLGEVVLFPIGNRVSRGTLAQREREAILATLDATGWRLTECARRLGISRTTLWRRLNAYGLKRDRR